MESILIFGGSSGLGLELAKVFYQKGFSVVIASSNAIKSKAALFEVHNETNPAQVFSICSDVSKIDDVKKVQTFCKELNLKISGIINCAGIFYSSPIGQTDFSIFSKVVETNLMGNIYLLETFIDELKETEGFYATLVSKAALRGIKGEAAYSATKWGVRGYLEAARAELLGSRVKVISVYPGAIDTPYWKNWPENFKEISQKKLLDPSKVASVIADNLIHSSDLEVSEIVISRI